jgi:integrase
MAPTELPLAGDTADRLALYRAASRAPATRRAYRSDWAHFQSWCQETDHVALPTTIETVCEYLAFHAGSLKASTLDRRLAALADYHRAAGHPFDPGNHEIRSLLSGIRRVHGARPQGKLALTSDDMRAMVTGLPGSLAGARDRALLLLGFAGGFRRSELAGLEIGMLDFRAGGLVVRLPSGKTDPDGAANLIKGIAVAETGPCPVAAVKDWIIRAHLGEGPLFRPIDRLGRIQPNGLQPRAVARILRKAAGQAAEARGLCGRRAEQFIDSLGAHSLRAGFASSAAMAGSPEWAIQRQTGHQRRQTLWQYIRPADALMTGRMAKTGL